MKKIKIKNPITIMIIACLCFLQGLDIAYVRANKNWMIATDKWNQSIQDDLTSTQETVDGRLARIEAHFTGHRVIIAKNGVGITFEPCKLGTKGCGADDKGIIMNHATIKGFYVGLGMPRSVAETPGLTEKH